MKGIVREIIAIILCVLIVFAVSVYAGYIYNPTRTSFGGLWNMYKCEDENSVDVMFVGSSLTYCDIIPAEIYEQTGHTAYVLGGPNLTLPIGYYYIKEGLKTQKPEVMFVEVSSLFFKKYEDDTKSNIGYMPYNLNRLGAIFNGAPKEERLGLVFPLYNLHDKWDEVAPKAYFEKREDVKTDILAGYTYLTDARDTQGRSKTDITIDREAYEYNAKYLRKIVDLCGKNGVELCLLIVPQSRWFTGEQMELIEKDFGDVPLADFNGDEAYATVGLDTQKDFYDNMHLNFFGAVKFSKTLGAFIGEKITPEIRDHDKALWEERMKYYTELKASSPS